MVKSPFGIICSGSYNTSYSQRYNRSRLVQRIHMRLDSHLPDARLGRAGSPDRTLRAKEATSLKQKTPIRALFGAYQSRSKHGITPAAAMRPIIK